VRQTSPVLALRQARQQLLETGQCPAGVLDERLTRSWHRSVAAGLVPTGRVATDLAGSGSLRQVLASNHVLLAHSRPVMEYVFEQVRHSHSQSVVVLADHHGMLMHTLGDASFVGKAERVALASGASWHEAHRGTNAIGTALAECSPIEIHGSEHFLERNGFLTCAASPIFSATGELMGVLDISGDHRHGHGHTLGLASTAARMIENRLILATCKRNIRLHLHAQPEGIGSVAEGIVALSDDGWIVGANRVGLALLRLNAGDIGATLLERVLDVRLDDLLSRHKRRPQQAQQMRLHNGAVLFVQVQVDPSVLLATHLSPPVSGRAQANSGLTDALTALDTGDTRWRSAADKARRVVAKPIPVLIQGESGVGKELFARAMHASGPRRDAPFVAINCGAIPESLIESELFGYVAGAFTGARKEGSLGRLREADGGTLFLDEIGDMPLALQTRLLRVLQERTVTPVGAGKAVPVDFALVCATHSKLAEAAEQGSFRQDLYYRINGLTVQLPALRERTDFCALTERLLADLSSEREVQLAPELLARLSDFAWPGNLRQYASVLRTACAMLLGAEDTLDWAHMPDDLVDALRLGHAAKTLPMATVVAQAPQSLQALGAAAIQQALEAAHGNVSLAARQLGISRQTLYRKLRSISAA
jgi:sigma-54 dependent transcriptional regulator, acetoin dehydrogenase operon transcriptional activator AcoR